MFSVFPVSFKIPYEDSAYEDFTVAEDGAVYSVDGTTLIYVPSAYSGAFSIPAGVTNIGAYAFAGCYEITSIDIPASVTYVGENAFGPYVKDCEWSIIPRVNFADWNAWMANVKMENLDSNPYRHGNIAYAGGIPVTIAAWPEGMTEIPDYVLAGIKFNFSDEVVLPANLRKIGAYAFFNQKEIYAAELPATLEEIGEGAFKGCELLENPVFPAGLQSIGSYAYSDCLSLTKVDLPEGLASLGEGVFAGDTALEKAALMADVTEVGTRMFGGCSALRKVYLPAETVSIGDYAFIYCHSLDEITLPATVEKIGASAFYHCALTKITLPNSLSTLGESAFDFNNLSEVTIGSGLETIPSYAFADNPIRQLNLSEGLKEIGANAFRAYIWNASIGYLALPSTVESIGENAFASCAFGELVVNEGIGELAAGSLGRPNVLTLPSTVRSIAPGTIDPEDCRLKVLRVKSSNPPALSEALSFSTDINDNLVMIVNAGSKSTYERNARWKQISNIKEDGETEIVVYMTGDYPITEEIRTTSGLMPSVVTKMSVIGPMTVNDLDLVGQNMISLLSLDLSAATGINEIPDGLFEGSTLKEVILPSTVTRIGDCAFADCIMLSMSELPAAVTEIGNGAFTNSPRISLSALPEVLETIGNGAFSNCHGLRNLTFGQALTSVGYRAFSGCSMLETVDFTQSAISSVPDDAFYGCSMLDEVLLPKTVERIGSYAFRGTDVRDIEFAAAVTNIGSHAFADCRRLVSANIPEGVAEAAEYTFASCPRLVSASFPVGVTTVGTNIFYNDKRLATLSSASSEAPRAVRGAFDNIRTRYISLTVPYNAFREYLSSAQWGSFETIKAGLPMVIPEQVEVSAILEEDYQELLREDYLEEQSESAAAEEEIPTPAERVAAGARAVRRAAQRATANEGRSFARLFDGAGLNTGAGTRIFINPKDGDTLLSVLVGGEEMIDQMEGNSLFIPASAAGSIEIRASSEQNGVGTVVADGEIDYNSPYEVYDIKGACVGNSVDRLASGIYIIRQGGVAKKIAVK